MMILPEFELARPKERVDGVERDRFIEGEFLVGVPYGCRMVLSNTSSAPVELIALVQIPEGALPVYIPHATRALRTSSRIRSKRPEGATSTLPNCDGKPRLPPRHAKTAE